MGQSLPLILKRGFFLLLVVPFVALVFSHSIPWLAFPGLMCPLDDNVAPLPILDFDRYDFPKKFVFGSATAAYQVEGAVEEGGRGPSIWDTFAHTAGKIVEDGNADVSADQYHLFEKDIDILKSMNMDAYRFSISWSRIFPDGRKHDVNNEGIAYYNRLIDALLNKGIQPYVTLYHWDLPEALEEAVDGWLSRNTVKFFGDFAEQCFASFGDRVKHWITINEPSQVSWQGYGSGSQAPGRTSDRTKSKVGNTSTEPYIVSHHLLLAHATAVDIYRRKFQAKQKGQIGISVDCEWGEPTTESAEDVEAAERRLLFQMGMYLDPIFFGDYPVVMRDNVGARLPRFSPNEVALLRNSVDFIGLNHYTTKWVSNAPPRSDPSDGNYQVDQCVRTSDTRDGVKIGGHAFSFWLTVVPWGMEKLILWTWQRYKTPLLITENGFDTKNNQTFGKPVPKDFLRDPERIDYYHGYLAAVLNAIRHGAVVKGYFAWSLLDNFEWAMGYTSRFGLFYVDYKTRKRYAKDSARWFAMFLHSRDGFACHTSAL